jgi:hypothetical protein
MQSKNVREVKQAISQQAMKGTRRVNVDQGRVIDAKTVKGQLKVRLIGGSWTNADHVNID